MRRTTAAVLAFACLSLLALQWSGAHAHAGVHGFDGALHSTHDHHHDQTHHDGDVDVPVVDYGLGAAKLLFLVLVSLCVLVSPRLVRCAAPPWINALFARRRMRWRPPLRAPPLFHSV